MVEVDELEFGYRDGEFLLRTQALSVARGQTVALIGPSGTGKTTLLNLLAGILVPREGQIRINRTTVSSLSDGARRDFRLRTMGLVFQEFELLEYLSVLDNILLPYRISSALALTADVRQRACTLAEDVGLGGKVGRRPGQLSQGERQRVALCRALLPRPPLVLADEPTGNLDPANRDRTLSIVFDYLRAQHATLIAVTHEHDLLDRFERVVDVSELRRGNGE